MTTKKYLERAYRLDLKINTKLEQVEHMRSLAYKVTVTFEQERVTSSKPVNPMENAIVKIIDAEHELNLEIDKLIDVKNQIASMIRLVENADQVILMELRYLCFNSWEQIAVKMGYSCSYIYKLHNAALASFEQVINEGGTSL